jgi:hypothetical protein
MPVSDRRRPPDQERHQTAVHLMGDRLIVLCRCGKAMGGARYEDRRILSLSDILSMVREHSSELNATRYDRSP